MSDWLRPDAGAEPAYRMPIEVYYEDTDLSGVVYHANYLKYFERVRSRWVRQLGVDQERLLAQGLAFTVADLKIRYLRPARLDMELEATLTVTLRRAAQLRFYQCLRSPTDSTMLFAEADVRVACVDTRRFRPVRLPDALTSRIPGDSR